MATQNPTNELLSLQEYQHLNDIFTSGVTAVYLNDFYLSDCVNFSYNVLYDKLPIYPYNSEYFSAVAPGNVIVEGSFGVIFTESSYFEIIRQNLINQQTKTRIQQNLQTLESDGTVPSTDIYGTPIVSYITNEVPVTSNETFALSIYRNTRREVVSTAQGDTVQKQAPHIRNRTISDLMGGVDSYKSSFEDTAEMLEDQIWGSPNSVATTDNIVTDERNGFAVWDPYSTRIRNEMEMDFELIKTSDQYVRNIMSNDRNPFHFYVIYGDYNTQAADHTAETISDIHIRSRQIVINNDGMPVIALYSFFGRILNANTSKELRRYSETKSLM